MEKFPKQCVLQYNAKGYSTGVTDRDARLNLQQFSFAFFVLFVGCLIAFVQFLREKMHHNFELKQLKEEEKKKQAFVAVAQLIAALQSTTTV